MRLQVDLFGPVRARRGDEELTLGSAHRRTLLAVLAFHANQAVSRSELIDAIWDDRLPTSASGSIYTYVSSLRTVLEPERSQRGAAEVLTSSGPGYCLRLDPEAIDVVRFENLRERGRQFQREGDFAGAVTALDAALGLYREEPLSGLAGPYAVRQRARLEELRLDVVERRARLLLDLGDHAKAVDEVSPFARQYPMREGLQALVLLALYRCGRREDALRAFERLRAGTIELLGTEPGTELTARYEQIKADAPALWHPLNDVPHAATVTRSPRLERPEVFVGRAREVAVIRAAVSDVKRGHGGSLWFEGEPGIGKSAVVAAGLHGVSGCRIGAAAADAVNQGDPLEVVLQCLDLGAGAAATRRADAVAAARHVRHDDPRTLARAVDQLAALAAKWCQEGALVLVADNLHRADPASLEAWKRLEAETRRLPLLLIGLCRRVPGRPELDRVRGELLAAHTRLHTLQPLPECDVRDLVAGLVGSAPGAALLDLGRTAAGNPRYLRDVIEALDGEDVPAGGSELRPAIPAAAGIVLNQRLSFLTVPAAEALRWAALLDETFSPLDLAAALDRPARLDDLLAELQAAGLLVLSRGKLGFRHPAIRQALYAKMPGSIRVALHRQLAEALDDAGAPVERVAAQLLAAPSPVDLWFHDWLARELCTLAPRSPMAAVRLLHQANTSIMSSTVPVTSREALTVATTRLMFWLGRPLTGEPGQVAARTANPEVAAELRWLMSCSLYRGGDARRAVEVIDEAMRTAHLPPAWRTLHGALRSRIQRDDGRSPASGQPPVPPIPVQRAGDGLSAAEAYRLGLWQVPLDELTRTLCSGPAVAAGTLGRPTVLRQLSGVAALIAAHRGRAADASTHLVSAWAQAEAEETADDGTDFMLAASAALAERENQSEYAFDLFSSMLELEDAAYCGWMPTLVRLATELGEHDHAKFATLLCERTPGQEIAALRCRAILDDDPTAALTAAAHLRAAGSVLGLAESMEDAAVLFGRKGKAVQAATALRTALRGYDGLGAVWDAQRARRRTRPFLGRPIDG